MANAQFKAEYYSGKDIAQAVYLVDSTGTLYTASGGGGGTSSNFGSGFPTAGTAAGFTDGANMRPATVAIFHNADNQSLPGTAYGILTGGVDQLLNASGNLDRKRSAYGDGLPTTGIESSGVMLWNGTSFDRWYSDATKTARVSLYGKHSSAGDTAIATDGSGNVMETLATLIAGEDLVTNRTVVELRYSYLNVVATGSTTVKSGAGFLHSLSINNPSALTSATTATTIKLYDNTSGSGTLIGTLSLPPSANLASALPFSLSFDDQFLTGLTIVITLGTSGAWTPDITVNYR